MRGRWLVVVYVSIILIPLVLSGLSDRPPRSFRDELASAMGMTAFAILLAEFLLSGRFRAISGDVGMDVTMRFHQLLARSALVLAILHPFLYAAPFGPELPFDTERTLSLAQPGPALVAGAVAWVLLPAFILTSIARADLFRRYENWRLGHGLGAAVIAGAAWYHVVEAGRYASDPVVYWVWTAMLLVALSSLLFVYVVRPLFQSRRPWRVSRIEPAAERTWRLDLEPVGHEGLRHRAGEFAWINIGHGAFSLSENPFSIASAPSQGASLSFVIKELGDFTRSLGGIAPGTRAYVDGPYGHLVVDGHDAPGIGLIAGGVGIAPMLSILRELEARQDSRPLTLLYGNRRASQIVAGEELARGAQCGGRKLVHVVSEPEPGWQEETGVLDPEMIARHFGTPEQRSWLYVLCGPPQMMTSVEKALIGLGVDPDRILLERFTYD